LAIYGKTLVHCSPTTNIPHGRPYNSLGLWGNHLLTAELALRQMPRLRGSPPAKEEQGPTPRSPSYAMDRTRLIPASLGSIELCQG